MDESLSIRPRVGVFLSILVLLAAGSASAQPFDAWLVKASGHGYVQLPNSSSLDFSGGSFTFEAWVSVTDGGACSSLAGNNWQQSTWIGVCGTLLRSYVSGVDSSYTVGTVPAANWTHVAVTFDAGTNTRSHYIDGELAGQTVESGGITSSGTAWRIFSDSQWQFTPAGAIDEVRFWNTARTRQQIRDNINKKVHAATSGLVAVYALDGNATDALGSLHGTKMGTANYLTAPVATGCTSNDTSLCLGTGGRFQVSATWSTPSSSGTGKVVPFQTTDSGLFTFFSSTNWEVMIKVLNGCPVNSRFWVFSAGITNVHVELVVTDMQHGETKRYFNYQGGSFNAINDTSAFATCP